MSLLSDLQEEVRKIRSQERAQDAQRETERAYYQQHLRPVMLRAYAYFAEIVENLNIVSPDITVRYPLDPQLEHGIRLKQSQYKYRADNRESPRQIDIICRCTLEKPHEFHITNPRTIQQHTELLDNYNFPYHRKNRLDRHHQVRGATFILEGPMMVHIRITANAAKRSVQIGLRNLEQQPVKRYSFPPADVTEELLERLAKVLLRQLPRLEEKQVDPGLRQHLQSQIKQQRYETEQDLTRAFAERQASQQAEQNASMIQRTGRLLQQRTRELLAALGNK